ncbi:MAG: VanZ family protein [Methylotenera sp.]|nr:VanZ family protein [Methylotenera sp.]
MSISNRLIKRRLPTFVTIFLIGLLFIGGSQSGAGSLFVTPWDKLAHIVFFFCLTIFLFAGFNFSIVTTSILALLIGMLDEFHQIFLPGRFAGVDDWFADVVGVMLATGFIFLRRRRK